MILCYTCNHMSSFQWDAKMHVGTRWHVQGSRPSWCFLACEWEASSQVWCGGNGLSPIGRVFFNISCEKSSSILVMEYQQHNGFNWSDLQICWYYSELLGSMASRRWLFLVTHTNLVPSMFPLCNYLYIAQSIKIMCVCVCVCVCVHIILLLKSFCFSQQFNAVESDKLIASLFGRHKASVPGWESCIHKTSRTCNASEGPNIWYGYYCTQRF